MDRPMSLSASLFLIDGAGRHILDGELPPELRHIIDDAGRTPLIANWPIGNRQNRAPDTSQNP